MTMMISCSSYGWLSFLTTTTIIMCVMASPGHAQQAFKSPDNAASALADAVRSGAAKDILKALGPDGADIIDSGDDVSDIAARDHSCAAHREQSGTKGRTLLAITRWQR
jgi:Protein of unknown function (DUF2950)